MSSTLRLHVLPSSGAAPRPSPEPPQGVVPVAPRWLSALDRYLEDLALEPGVEPEDVVLIPLDDEQDDDPYGMAGFLAA